MHAIVLGGSRGIGHAIAKSLHKAGCDVYAASKKDIDTSDLESVKKFASAHPKTDVLVLNTGGPPPMEFDDITEEDWQKYHNQLFLGFCLLVRQINIADGGYLFLISSSVLCQNWDFLFLEMRKTRHLEPDTRDHLWHLDVLPHNHAVL